MTELRQTTKAARPSGKRRDIEGLRAIAVLAVIADHLLGWPRGGFIGVDVFFVISGFLITGLLLGEHDRTGTISFRGFYRRRIRRIIPASVLVLAVTLVGAHALFNAGRFRDTVGDAVAAFLFAGNWRFAATGTDYFQSTGDPSPLQHFWSLAVEEQFYFVWPWLMLAVLALAARRSPSASRGRIVTGAVLACLTVASFAWALHETVSAPSIAYFSTFSRAWELGVGALLAVGARRLTRLPDGWRPFGAWVGLIGIAASLFLVSAESSFPAPWAALPVLSTGLLIAAGTGGRHVGLGVIRNPVMGYVGRISYSLYLWHFPAIIFTSALLGSSGLLPLLVAAGATAFLAIASFHLVEDPIRRSTWLTGMSADERRSRRRSARANGGLIRPATRRTAIGAACVAVAVLATAALTVNRTPSPDAGQVPVSAPTSTAGASDAPVTASSEVEALVASAVSAAEWPLFDPAIEDLAQQRAPQWTEGGCIDVTNANVAECVYGNADAPRTMAVLGDSVATSWLPGLIAGLGDEYRIQALTKQACGVSRASISAPQGDASRDWQQCTAHHDWVAARLAADPPDVVVVAESFGASSRLVSGAQGSAHWQEWRTGLDSALADVPDSSRIVTLMAPPGAESLRECYSPVSSPSDCLGTPSPTWDQMLMVERASTEEAGGTFVDTRDWFCASDQCTSFVGTTATYVDDFHLSRAYSSLLGPALAEAVRAPEEAPASDP